VSILSSGETLKGAFSDIMESLSDLF